jgi:hypothetical protein
MLFLKAVNVDGQVMEKYKDSLICSYLGAAHQRLNLLSSVLSSLEAWKKIFSWTFIYLWREWTDYTMYCCNECFE